MAVLIVTERPELAGAALLSKNPAVAFTVTYAWLQEKGEEVAKSLFRHQWAQIVLEVSTPTAAAFLQKFLGHLPSKRKIIYFRKAGVPDRAVAAYLFGAHCIDVFTVLDETNDIYGAILSEFFEGARGLDIIAREVFSAQTILARHSAKTTGKYLRFYGSFPEGQFYSRCVHNTLSVPILVPAIFNPRILPGTGSSELYDPSYTLEGDATEGGPRVYFFECRNGEYYTVPVDESTKKEEPKEELKREEPTPTPDLREDETTQAKTAAEEQPTKDSAPKTISSSACKRMVTRFSVKGPANRDVALWIDGQILILPKGTTLEGLMAPPSHWSPVDDPTIQVQLRSDHRDEVHYRTSLVPA